MPMPKKPTEESIQQKQSPNQCLDSIKMGFAMGAGVGSTFGVCMMLFVLVPKKVPVKTLIKYTASQAIKMGGMFGCFMGIGGALRCEEDEHINNNNNNKNTIFNYTNKFNNRNNKNYSFSPNL